MGTGSDVGATGGGVAGGVVGSYFGPVGTVAGSYLGSKVGGWLGGLFDGGGGGPDQTQVAKDAVAAPNAMAGNIYNEALQQAEIARGIAQPGQIVAPAVVAGQLDTGAYNVNTNTNAKAVNVVDQMRAYQAAQAQTSDAAVQNLRNVDAVKAAQINAAETPDVRTNISAPTIGEAAQTGGVQVDRTRLDPLANQLRDGEIKAAQDISSGPSAAMAQFQAGQSQVVKDQMAVAAAARGIDRAGARREAMINIGANGAQQNLAASALAAQESQAKKVAAASALSNIRSQDVTSATNAASITAQQQNLQAQLDAAIAQGNTSAINAIKEQQAQLSLQANTSSVQAGLAQQSTKAALATANMQQQQQTALANQAAANKAAADNASAANAAYSQYAQNATATNLQNASTATGAAKDNAAAVNTAANAYAAAATNTNLQNAALTQQQAQTNASRALAADTTNVAGGNTASAANAGNAISAQTTNAANQLNTDQLRQQGATNALSTGINATNVLANTANTVTDAKKSSSAQSSQNNAALIGAAGSVAAAYLGSKTSDERAKLDVSRVDRGTYADKYGQMLSESFGPSSASASPYGTLSDARVKREVDSEGMEGISDFTRKAPAVTYRYKPGIEDGGQAYQAGTLAQGVEAAGPIGKMFVDERPDGLKEVKYGPMAHFEAKGAQATADHALQVALAAYRRAS